jgi:hypothetical protein
MGSALQAGPAAQPDSSTAHLVLRTVMASIGNPASRASSARSISASTGRPMATCSRSPCCRTCTGSRMGFMLAAGAPDRVAHRRGPPQLRECGLPRLQHEGLCGHGNLHFAIVAG